MTTPTLTQRRDLARALDHYRALQHEADRAARLHAQLQADALLARAATAKPPAPSPSRGAVLLHRLNHTAVQIADHPAMLAALLTLASSLFALACAGMLP